MRAPVVSFEVRGPQGRIVMLEDDCVVEENVSDDTYRCCSSDTNVEAIPRSFYHFMKSFDKFPVVDSINFCPNIWQSRFQSFLSENARKKLYNFQMEAVYKMVTLKKCLNATSMGCGKSIQALCALSIIRSQNLRSSLLGSDKDRLNDLIICPGYLRDNWAAEAKQWLPDTFFRKVTIIRSAGSRVRESILSHLLYEPGIKIISYDMAASLFAAIKPGLRKQTRFFNTVICDESHYLKESNTKRYRMLSDIIKNANHTFLLSGTPAPNRPREIFAQASLLYPSIFNHFRTFAKRYCAGFTDTFGHFNDRGESHIEELSFLMSKFVIRIRREEVLTDLPAVSRNKVVLPCKTTAAFRKLKAEFTKKLSTIETDAKAKFAAQCLASKMFVETSKIKQDPVEKFLLDYLVNFGSMKNIEKTIIFCKHQSMLHHIKDKVLDQHFKCDSQCYVAISGETNSSERVNQINYFLTSETCKIALLTIGSCSTGLNITPIARMIFAEMSWSPAELSQCEARISRIGGARHLEYTYLVCENTLDESVFQKLTNKNKLITSIVDRGQDYGDFMFESGDDSVADTCEDTTRQVKRLKAYDDTFDN